MDNGIEDVQEYFEYTEDNDTSRETAGIMVTLHFYVYNGKKYVAKIGK